MLSVAGLHAGYDNQAVVRDITLTVAPGEVLGLLGPNGAGKTTTLNTIAGELMPLAGSITFDSRPTEGLAVHQLARAGMTLMPEGRGLFHGLTVREHLRLSPSGNPLPESELLEMVPELEKRLNERAGNLSGGEQQMLAVARALGSRPKALLVDEMSLGLAPVIVERLLPLIRRAADEFGTAVLLVEQHVRLALQIADRAIVISHGRVVLEGTGAHFRENPELLAEGYLGDTAGAGPQ